MNTLQNSEPTPEGKTFRTYLERARRSTAAKVIAVLGVGAFALTGVALNEHRQQRISNAVEHDRAERIEAAVAREKAIDKLALSDPEDTALAVVAEFTVPEGSNITTEAFAELNAFIERRVAAGEPALEGFTSAELDSVDETILVSGLAHEANGSTQPGKELFLVTVSPLSYEGHDSLVAVVQKIQNDDSGNKIDQDIPFYDENA